MQMISLTCNFFFNVWSTARLRQNTLPIQTFFFKLALFPTAEIILYTPGRLSYVRNNYRRTQQLPTLLAQQCRELLRAFARGQKSLTGFNFCATTCNRECRRTQHVTSNNVRSCWLTMLRPFTQGFIWRNMVLHRRLSPVCCSSCKTFVWSFTMK